MRLEIDGKEADLSNNIIAITRKVIDLSNLSLRNIDITNRLKLPKTNTNQEIFESADRVETTGDGLDKLYKAKIIDQFFIFNGLGFLNEANSTYNFQLSENSKELLSQLNGKINLLPYDEFDFTFNQTSYDALKLFDPDNIWSWPIIAMHTEKTGDNTRFESGNDGLKYSRPVFNFKKILTDSVEALGWSIELDTSIIDRLGISSNASKFYITSYQKTLDQTINVTGTPQNLTGLNTNDFEYGILTQNTYINTGSSQTIFRLRGNVVADADIKVTFKSVSIGTTKEQTKEFIIKKGQTYVDFKTSAFKPSSPDTDVSVFIILDGFGNITFDNTYLYTIIEEQKLGDLSGNPLLNYRIKAFDNMPDKQQIDILRDAIKITNSIIVPDSFNKMVYLKSLKALSKLKSVDWSNKFDADNYSVTNSISGYAQKNYLIYDNDETVNSDLGEDFFTVNNEALSDEVDMIQLKYGASEEVIVQGGGSFTVASFDIYNDTERENEVNNRLIYIYDDQAAATYTLARFIEIDWRTLKAEYYQNWLDSFNRLRIIEGVADLNKLDVIGHDFLDLVYIDEFKSNFFVLSIEDYTEGRKTKVELFKFL